MNYWAQRNIKAQRNLSKKSVQEIEEQLIKYYLGAQEKIIGQFIETYNKVLLSVAEGREPTPADLYKLDSYWQGQAQLRDILKQLGNKEAELLSAQFIQQYIDIYNNTAIPGVEAFNTVDIEIARQVVESIWCADGKSWSERIWDNIAELMQTLEDELTNCLITGKKTTELKQILQNRFNVSYHRADMLIRTEIAHITTQAAQKRYTDYGVEMVEVWADKDERQCEYCGTLHMKRYPVGGKMPIPAHPNCRCNLIPVVELKSE